MHNKTECVCTVLVLSACTLRETMTKILWLKLKINLIDESTFSNEMFYNILRLHIAEACTHEQVHNRLFTIQILFINRTRIQKATVQRRLQKNNRNSTTYSHFKVN